MKLWTLLLHKLLFCGTLFFAAAAPVISDGFSGVPTGPDTSPEPDAPSSPEPEPAAEQGEPTAAETPAKEATGKADSALKSHLAELKTANPALHKQLNDIYWGYQNLKGQITKNFPGGLKDAIELKQEIETLGGREAIQGLNEEIGEYRQFDDAWMKGDPSFLDRAIETGGKDGFVKLAPSLTGKWAEVDPQGYDKYFAGAMYNTLRESEIPTELRLAIGTLSQFDLEKAPALKGVVESLTKAYGWMTKSLKEIATKEPERPAVQPNQLEQERATLREEKMGVVTEAIQNRIFTAATPTIDNVVKDLRKGIALPDGGKQQIVSDTFSQIFQILAADKSVEQKYDSYLDAGDKEGAYKFLSSKVTPLLQAEARKAYKRLYGEPTLGSKKPVAAAKPNGKPVAAPEAGFQLVGFDPKPSSIDRVKTTNQMLFKNQAILKDGRKITWRPGSPLEK